MKDCLFLGKTCVVTGVLFFSIIAKQTQFFKPLEMIYICRDKSVLSWTLVHIWILKWLCLCILGIYFLCLTHQAMPNLNPLNLPTKIKEYFSAFCFFLVLDGPHTLMVLSDFTL